MKLTAREREDLGNWLTAWFIRCCVSQVRGRRVCCDRQTSEHCHSAYKKILALIDLPQPKKISTTRP